MPARSTTASRFSPRLAALGLIGAALLPGAARLAASPARASEGSAKCSHVKHAATGHWRARLYPPTHHPRVGNFPIKVTAHTLSGHPISGGHIYYQFLLSGQVVACRNVGPPEKPRFNSHGVFSDTLQWPATAIGYPITLRVVATTGYGLRNLDWTVTVHR